VLFVQFGNNERMVVQVELASTGDRKQAQMAALGKSLRQTGKDISEAVLVSEGWLVTAQEGKCLLDVPPSQHPDRQEAIVLIGRDAAGGRVSSVIQPFGRDPENKPLWDKPVMATYNQAADHGYRQVSLLDQLFTSISERR